MRIKSQDRTLSVPYRGARLKIKDSYTVQIIALMPNNNGEVIAEYSDYDRAKQILEEMDRNEETRARSWLYYMPAE